MTQRGDGLRKKLLQTTKEALSSVLPITAVVLLLSLSVLPMAVGTLMIFIGGAVLLVIGMGLFTMGADMALMPMGEDIGIKMTRTKKTLLVVLVSLAMGIIITIAEPDLQVLANLVQEVPSTVLVLTIALGVGIFLVLAIFRILLRVSLSRLLIVCYGIVMVVSIFVPDNFLSVAFDSGGVTTGPITVPFIMAMGLGLASIRGDRESMEDSFGLVALCSIGPILAVLILGICYQPANTPYELQAIPEIETSIDVSVAMVGSIPGELLEVAKSVWPILAVLALFQLLTRRYSARQMVRLLIGFIYTYIGLVLFLTGVNVGFIPIGQSIGAQIANTPFKWFLVPLGGLIGYFIVAAEPAVHVLKKQVEEVSGGAIPAEAVMRYLSIGTAVSLALSMVRVLTGLSIYWFLIPGYAIALTLTFFVPKIFVGIAFDSGGVVSGPMTSTFLLPFAIGACVNPENIMTDAFGLVAMVAMTPLIALQLMGFVYKNKLNQTKENAVLQDGGDDEIIEFEEDPADGT